MLQGAMMKRAVLLSLCVQLGSLAAMASPLLPCQGDARCDLALGETKLQPVPVTFQFQARVSEARFPAGDALFRRLYVHLGDGSGATPLCSEEFTDVKAVAGVLNLEIGRAISCPLAEVLAENRALSFQLCIGGSENCLKPVQLATLPLAAKADYANAARAAHTAETAIWSDIATRATADRDLYTPATVGDGYFDFYSPTPEEAAELFSHTAYEAHLSDGYVQWAPVTQGGAAVRLNVAGKDADDKARALDTLTCDAGLTVFAGARDVYGDSSVQGFLDISGEADRAHQGGEYALVVEQGGMDAQGTLDVARDATVGGQLTTAKRVLLQFQPRRSVLLDDTGLLLRAGLEEPQNDVSTRLRIDRSGLVATGELRNRGPSSPHLRATAGASLLGSVSIGAGSAADRLDLQAPSAWMREVTFEGKVIASQHTVSLLGDRTEVGQSAGLKAAFGGTVAASAPVTIGRASIMSGMEVSDLLTVSGGATFATQAEFNDGVIFSERVTFEHAVTLGANVGVPASGLADGSVANRHLRLTNYSCALGSYVQGLQADGSPVCRANMTLQGAAPSLTLTDTRAAGGLFVTLAGGAGRIGGKLGLKFAAFDQYKLELTRSEALQTAVELARGLEVEGDLRVDGDVTGLDIDCLEVVGKTYVAAASAGSSVSELAAVSCADGYTMLSGTFGWYNDRPDNSCDNPNPTDTRHSLQENCFFGGSDSFTCEVRNSGTGASDDHCFQLRGRCCRVR
jgi:hypothetical protein